MTRALTALLLVAVAGCGTTDLKGQPSTDSSTGPEDTVMDPRPDPRVEDVLEDPAEEPLCPPACDWSTAVGLGEFEGPTDALDLDLECELTEVEWLLPYPALNRYHLRCEEEAGVLEFYVGIHFSVVFHHAGYWHLVEGDRVHLRYFSEFNPESPEGFPDRWMTMRNPDGSLAIAAMTATRLHPTDVTDNLLDPIQVSLGEDDCFGREDECFAEYRRPLVFTCTDPSCEMHEVWDCSSDSFSASDHTYWIDVGYAVERREIVCPDRPATWYGFVIASE